MNTTRRQALTRRPIALAASLLCALGAQAQTTPDEEAQTVDKIVITAQKREQAAIDVPASVSTVSAESLQRSGAVRLEDYAAKMPGLSITALSRGYTSVVLRGISTGISQATPSTAYYIDEAPVGSITAYATGSTLTPDLDPYDLRRVEVLKGPQGTLYGAGAVGGLLRYVSVTPDSTRFGGQVSLGGHKISGGGSGHEARAALNVPLAENRAAFRVSLLDRDDAGYIDNPVNGESDVNQATTRGGRLSFGLAVNDNWSLLAWAQTQQFRAGGLGAHDLNGPALTPATGDLEHSSQTPEKQAIDLDIFNATIKGYEGGFDIVSSTTYQTVKADTIVDVSRTIGATFSAILNIPNIGARTHQTIDTKRWSQEIRARSTAMDERLQYEFGYFYTQEESTNRLPPEPVFINPTGAPLPLGNLFDAKLAVKYREHSVFGNATYSITPQFDVMAGLRFSRDEQDFSQDYQASLAVPAPVVFDQSVTNSTTTYLLSGIYKLDAKQVVYGRVATGYRPGGPSALPATLGKPSFDPDTLTSYELGYKAAFAGGKASVEAAVFTTDWKDIQVQRATVSGGATYQHFVNAGTAKSSGAEVTLLVFPVTGLTLRATAAYTDSHLTEDAPVVSGLSGDRMPFVPEITASFTADYRFAVGNGMQAWVGGSVGHVGERRSNFSQQANVLDVPSYTTLGLNAGLDAGNWRLSVYGKNLTDERGINFMNTIGLANPATNPVGNPYAAGVVQPRTLGVDVSYRF